MPTTVPMEKRPREESEHRPRTVKGLEADDELEEGEIAPEPEPPAKVPRVIPEEERQELQRELDALMAQKAELSRKIKDIKKLLKGGNETDGGKHHIHRAHRAHRVHQSSDDETLDTFLESLTNKIASEMSNDSTSQHIFKDTVSCEESNFYLQQVLTTPAPTLPYKNLPSYEDAEYILSEHVIKIALQIIVFIFLLLYLSFNLFFN